MDPKMDTKLKSKSKMKIQEKVTMKMIKQYWQPTSLVCAVSAGAVALGLSMAANAQKPTAPAPTVPTSSAPAVTAAATPNVAGLQKVTSVEGITEYRMANGMKVLLFPDASKPTVTVNVTYLVGSRHENYGETGMAHLLEHLLFKGTPKNPDISNEFSKRGARRNASTWIDRTNYYEQMQATDDNVEWALQMEADRMVNSFVAKKDLDSEMTVVRNEFESRETTPFLVMLSRMQSVAYDWHNYGKTTIGNRSDIENVKIENLQAFYRMYYQPDNAVLLVAGKFDEAKTMQWISKYFGAIPKATRTMPKLWTTEPIQDGERTFAVRRKGDVQIVALGYKIPSGLHADSDALGFVNFALTDSPTGRLHKALVETGKAAQIIGLPINGVDSGLHLIGAVVKKGEAVEVVQAELIRVVEDFYKNPLTNEELDRAKKSFANASETALNNHESIGLQMSEYIALGDWRLFFHSREQTEKTTVEQVKAAAARYYKRDNRVVGLYLPEDNPQRAEIVAAPSAAEVLKDFKGKTTVAQSEAFDPSNTNIDKRTKRIDVGGIAVALLSKQNRGETANVSVRFRSGDEKTLFGKSTVANLTSQMVSRGTTKFSRAQLADELSKLKVTGAVNGLSANMQTTKPNLVAALKLAAHVMREPTFPESEFEQLKKQTLTGLEAQKSDPQAVASVASSKHFNKYPRGDVRYSSSFEESEEDIKAVTLQQVRDFHKQFYGATKGEIAIVGDFDEATVTQAIREAFGDWKGGAAYTRVPTPYQDVVAANRKIETPDKENAVFIARTNVNMQEDDTDYAAFFVADYIMGGGAGFDSRLTKRIRVKEGLSYTAVSQLSVDSTDRGSLWLGFAIAAPQNMEKVEAAFKDEVAKALKDGFTEAEVTAAKSGALQRRAQARAQDAGVARAWGSNMYLGRTFAWSAKLEERITALKAEDVNAAFRKHINVEKITIVKAGDFVKAAKLPPTVIPAAAPASAPAAAPTK
jgi:zinc protease